MAGHWETLHSSMPGLAGAGKRSDLDSGTAWTSGARGIFPGHLRSKPPVGTHGAGAPAQAAGHGDPDNTDHEPGKAWAAGPGAAFLGYPLHRPRCVTPGAGWAPSDGPHPGSLPPPTSTSTNTHRFCYICGFAIQWSNGMSGTGDGKGDEADWFGKENWNQIPINSTQNRSFCRAGSGECEHVSPSSLMSSTVGPNRTSIHGALEEWYSHLGGVNWENLLQDHLAFQLYIWNELYDWAHVACNQKKLDQIFIKVQGNTALQAWRMGDLAIDASWFYSLMFGPGPGGSPGVPVLAAADPPVAAADEFGGMNFTSVEAVNGKNWPAAWGNDKETGDAEGDCKWSSAYGTAPAKWNVKFRKGVYENSMPTLQHLVALPPGPHDNPWGKAVDGVPKRTDRYATGFCKWNGPTATSEARAATAVLLAAAGPAKNLARLLALAPEPLYGSLGTRLLRTDAGCWQLVCPFTGKVLDHNGKPNAFGTANHTNTRFLGDGIIGPTAEIGLNYLAKEMWEGCRQRLLIKQQRVNYILGEGGAYVDERGLDPQLNLLLRGNEVLPGTSMPSNSYPFGWAGADFRHKYIWIGTSVAARYATDVNDRHLVNNPLFGSEGYRRRLARKYNIGNAIGETHIASCKNIALIPGKYFKRFAVGSWNKMRSGKTLTAHKLTQLKNFFGAGGVAGGGQRGGGDHTTIWDMLTTTKLVQKRIPYSRKHLLIDLIERSWDLDDAVKPDPLPTPELRKEEEESLLLEAMRMTKRRRADIETNVLDGNALDGGAKGSLWWVFEREAPNTDRPILISKCHFGDQAYEVSGYNTERRSPYRKESDPSNDATEAQKLFDGWTERVTEEKEDKMDKDEPEPELVEVDAVVEVVKEVVKEEEGEVIADMLDDKEEVGDDTRVCADGIINKTWACIPSGAEGGWGITLDFYQRVVFGLSLMNSNLIDFLSEKNPHGRLSFDSPWVFKSEVRGPFQVNMLKIIIDIFGYPLKKPAVEVKVSDLCELMYKCKKLISGDISHILDRKFFEGLINNTAIPRQDGWPWVEAAPDESDGVRGNESDDVGGDESDDVRGDELDWENELEYDSADDQQIFDAAIRDLPPNSEPGQDVAPYFAGSPDAVSPVSDPPQPVQAGPHQNSDFEPLGTDDHLNDTFFKTAEGLGSMVGNLVNSLYDKRVCGNDAATVSDLLLFEKLSGQMKSAYGYLGKEGQEIAAILGSQFDKGFATDNERVTANLGTEKDLQNKRKLLLERIKIRGANPGSEENADNLKDLVETVAEIAGYLPPISTDPQYFMDNDDDPRELANLLIYPDYTSLAPLYHHALSGPDDDDDTPPDDDDDTPPDDDDDTPAYDEGKILLECLDSWKRIEANEGINQEWYLVNDEVVGTAASLPFWGKSTDEPEPPRGGLSEQDIQARRDSANESDKQGWASMLAMVKEPDSRDGSVKVSIINTEDGKDTPEQVLEVPAPLLGESPDALAEAVELAGPAVPPPESQTARVLGGIIESEELPEAKAADVLQALLVEVPWLVDERSYSLEANARKPKKSGWNDRKVGDRSFRARSIYEKELKKNIREMLILVSRTGVKGEKDNDDLNRLSDLIIDQTDLNIRVELDEVDRWPVMTPAEQAIREKEVVGKVVVRTILEIGGIDPVPEEPPSGGSWETYLLNAQGWKIPTLLSTPAGIAAMKTVAALDRAVHPGRETTTPPQEAAARAAYDRKRMAEAAGEGLGGRTTSQKLGDGTALDGAGGGRAPTGIFKKNKSHKSLKRKTSKKKTRPNKKSSKYYKKKTLRKKSLRKKSIRKYIKKSPKYSKKKSLKKKTFKKGSRKKTLRKKTLRKVKK